MRVTEKGQVTIPKDIRDRLKIGPGSEVDFIAERKRPPRGSIQQNRTFAG